PGKLSRGADPVRAGGRVGRTDRGAHGTQAGDRLGSPAPRAGTLPRRDEPRNRRTAMKERAAEAGADERSRVDDRWTTRAPEGSPGAHAGALLRQALRPEPLDAGRLAAIRSRLRAGRRRPQRHWTLRLAIALVLV